MIYEDRKTSVRVSECVYDDMIQTTYDNDVNREMVSAALDAVAIAMEQDG